MLYLIENNDDIYFSNWLNSAPEWPLHCILYFPLPCNRTVNKRRRSGQAASLNHVRGLVYTIGRLNLDEGVGLDRIP